MMRSSVAGGGMVVAVVVVLALLLAGGDGRAVAAPPDDPAADDRPLRERVEGAGRVEAVREETGDDGLDAPRAPEFTLPEIGSGAPHQLTGFRGEVVLVMFWVSWAENCLHMADAHLLRIARSLQDAGKPFRVILIGGSHNDDEGKQQAVARQHGWPFLLLHDAGHEVARRYGAENFGWLTLIDEQGRIVGAGDSHVMLGQMEGWLSEHFDVTIATAEHAGNEAGVIMLVVVGVLALIVFVATRKRPTPATGA